MNNIRFSKTSFSRLKNPENLRFIKTVLEIVRFIILNYAAENEERSFKPLKTEVLQSSREFRQGITIRTDIVVKTEEQAYINDTKWKNIQNLKPFHPKPSPNVSYNEYWNFVQSILLNPFHRAFHQILKNIVKMINSVLLDA